MSSRPWRPLSFPVLVRAERGRALGGVCAGIGEALGVDATLVRLAFAFLSLASGAGVAAYAGAWLLLPAAGEPRPARRRRVTGIALLAFALLLALRGLGIADSLLWPVALCTVGALFARRMLGLGGSGGLGADVLGVALVIVGVIAFVSENGAGTGSPVIAPGGVALGLLLVVGPWAWRLARERDAERLERIRSAERAEMAARVHDSVLQTLALIRRDAADPRRVGTLARRQERELRAWLYGAGATPDGSLGRAIESAASDVEELYGVPIEIVRTGDADVDERVGALVLAAREAMANAAAHSGAEEVSVFVEAGPQELAVYVRDRGAGFEEAAVPTDRRGIADSIRARMSRAGGEVRVSAAPGQGTEVELVLRRAP